MAAKTEFKLTTEPDWPYSDFCAAYSFKLVGGPLNQRLIAAALTPRTKSGQADLRTREMLAVVLYRLHASKKRHKRINDPKYGNYRYRWDKLDDLAKEAGLSHDQAKRGMEVLIDGGIVYATRGTITEPRSYRLTDRAFMMAHTLQYPALRLNWAYRRLTTIKQEFEHDLTDKLRFWYADFPSMMDALSPLFTEWHVGQKETAEFIEAWDNHFADWFEPIEAAANE